MIEILLKLELLILLPGLALLFSGLPLSLVALLGRVLGHHVGQVLLRKVRL